MNPYVVKITKNVNDVVYWRSKHDNHTDDIRKAQLYWRIADAEYRKKWLTWLWNSKMYRNIQSIDIVEVKVNIKEKS